MHWKLVVAAIAASLLLAVTISGCGGEEKRGGPDGAVEDFIHLFNARKFGEAYDSLAASSPFRNASRQEFITEMERSYGDNPASYRFSDFQVKEVEIAGDEANVIWTATEATGLRNEKGDSFEARATAVQEGETWKVVVPWNAE